MAATKTVYLDAAGTQRDGYIIDGRTYEDEAGTRPVGLNSIVTTNDGAYIKTADGSMRLTDYLAKQKQSQETGTTNGLSDYITNTYTAKTDAELAGLKDAYARALTSYDAAAERLPQSYGAARNAAAAQNAMDRRSFDERAAAAGLGSGAAAQADLARNSVYRGTLADIDLAEAEASNALALNRADLQREYESAMAQARANGDAALNNALYNELVRVQGLEREDAKEARGVALSYGLADPAGLSVIRSLDDLARLETTAVTSLTPAQIMEMQRYYGTKADGIWGPKSYAAAGNRDSLSAWRNYIGAVN